MVRYGRITVSIDVIESELVAVTKEIKDWIAAKKVAGTVINAQGTVQTIDVPESFSI